MFRKVLWFLIYLLPFWKLGGFNLFQNTQEIAAHPGGCRSHIAYLVANMITAVGGHYKALNVQILSK